MTNDAGEKAIAAIDDAATRLWEEELHYVVPPHTPELEKDVIRRACIIAFKRGVAWLVQGIENGTTGNHSD